MYTWSVEQYILRLLSRRRIYFVHETKRNRYNILCSSVRSLSLNARQKDIFCDGSTSYFILITGLRHIKFSTICHEMLKMYLSNCDKYVCPYVTSMCALTWLFEARTRNTVPRTDFLSSILILWNFLMIFEIFWQWNCKLCSFVWQHCVVQSVMTSTVQEHTVCIFRLAMFMFWTAEWHEPADYILH